MLYGVVGWDRGGAWRSCKKEPITKEKKLVQRVQWLNLIVIPY